MKSGTKIGERIRQLREERGLTQETLARRARLTRGYLARLETNRHDPAWNTLRKLAKALGVGTGDIIMNRTMAVKVRFKLEKLFPPDDPLSVLMFRLMMATDDARHLQKLLLIVGEKLDHSASFDETILNGELGHLFRLLCGHLYEAGTALRDIDEKDPGRLDRLISDVPEMKSVLRGVRDAYNHGTKRGISFEFLHAVRTYVGFHYKPEKLRESYKRHLGQNHMEGALITTPFMGLGRYTVTDHLGNLVILDALGVDCQNFPQALQMYQEAIGESIRLAGALAEFVDRTLVVLLKQAPDAALEEQNGTTSVADELLSVEKKQAIHTT